MKNREIYSEYHIKISNGYIFANAAGVQVVYYKYPFKISFFKQLQRIIYEQDEKV